MRLLQVIESTTPIASTNDNNINIEGIGTLQDINKLVSTLKESVEGTSCDKNINKLVSTLKESVEGTSCDENINKLVSTLKESVEGTSGDEGKGPSSEERNPVVENDPEKALEFAVKGLGYVIQNLECMQEEQDNQGTNEKEYGSQDRSGQDRLVN